MSVVPQQLGCSTILVRWSPRGTSAAAGVCLYVILAGCLPFEAGNMPELLRRIQRAQYETPPWMSPAAARVIGMLLQPDPQQRHEPCP